MCLRATFPIVRIGARSAQGLDLSRMRQPRAWQLPVARPMPVAHRSTSPKPSHRSETIGGSSGGLSRRRGTIFPERPPHSALCPGAAVHHATAFDAFDLSSGSIILPSKTPPPAGPEVPGRGESLPGILLLLRLPRPCSWSCPERYG